MYFPLKGFEGIYQISKLGKIRTMDGIVMKFYESADGYLKITLVKNGKRSGHYLHLLVAKNF